MKFLALLAAVCGSAFATSAPYQPQPQAQGHGHGHGHTQGHYVVPAAPAPVPVAPVAPAAVVPTPVATVTVTVVPVAPSKSKAKVHTCGGWNRKYKKDCEHVKDIKCTMGSGSGSKYQKCSRDACCSKTASAVTVTVIPAAAPTAAPAPAAAPLIYSCQSVVKANNWYCGSVPNYGCVAGAPYGAYPSCSAALCCLAPPKPVDPCRDCGFYCPPQCKPKPQSCSKYNRCPMGYECVDDGCVFAGNPECSATKACVDGLTCQDGVCVQVDECGIDKPCAPGEECQGGVCVVLDATCDVDPTICFDGQACVDGVCVDDVAPTCDIDPSLCLPEEICDNGVCVPSLDDCNVDPTICVDPQICQADGTCA